jgi:CRP/FNR family transcriptional regulator, cyclic AMP receptor protein
MPISPADLRTIPLFAGITDEHLRLLMDTFERKELPPGEVLFEAGSNPDRLLLLVVGEVSLREGKQERFRLKPISTIGELGSMTGLLRNTTAVTSVPSEVWSIRTQALRDFFEKHGDIAFPLHYNVLSITADKIRRDQQRLSEMRENLISTQKAMKKMRDTLLESEDTPLHRMLFEELEKHIEKNRKAHYLVSPVKELPTKVRLDDGQQANISAISSEYIRLTVANNATFLEGSDWSGVLILPEKEIPISGRVESCADGSVVIRLDMLIDEYIRALEEHLTRLQLLDYVF